MEDLPVTKLEQSEYVSPRRLAGIARLAIHYTFDNLMSHAGDDVEKRQKACDKIRELRPGILKSLGVIEGFDD